MSKSWGNAIWLDDEPNEIFGKVMSLKDDLIIQYFSMATSISALILEEIKKRFNSRENRMILKKELAERIVSEIQDKKKAEKARQEFERVFQKRGLPTEVPTLEIEDRQLLALDLLSHPKLLGSRSEVKRLVSQKAVEFDGKLVENHKELIKIPPQGAIIKIGKRQIVRVLPTDRQVISK